MQMNSNNQAQKRDLHDKSAIIHHTEMVAIFDNVDFRLAEQACGKDLRLFI